MIGREACHRPMTLSEIYSAIAAAAGRDYRPMTVTEHLERMAEYAEREMLRGASSGVVGVRGPSLLLAC
jgi:hypothetical protein